MRKAILTALVAVLASAFWTGAASADNGIRVRPAATTLTMPRFTLEAGLGISIVCSMVVELTFHSSIVKVAGALLGTYTATVSTNRCSSGNMGFLVGGRRVTGPVGPGHMTYAGFSGTLPNITELKKARQDLSFWISTEGISCLTNGAVDITAETTGGNPASGWAIASQTIPVTGAFPCLFTSLTLNASGTLSEDILIQLF